MTHTNIFKVKTINFEISFGEELGRKFEYKQLLAEDELKMNMMFCYDFIDGEQKFDVRKFNVLKLSHNLVKAEFLLEEINEILQIEKLWEELDITNRIKVLSKLPSSIFEKILGKADEIDYPNLDLKKKSRS